MKPRIPALAPLTHIFLSLDLMESSGLNDEIHSYLKTIRENTERLQSLIMCYSMECIKSDLIYCSTNQSSSFLRSKVSDGS